MPLILNRSTQEAEAGRRGQPALHSEFQASQSYVVRPYLKKKRNEKAQLFIIPGRRLS